MKAFLISVILSIFAFALVLNNKEKKAILIIIFTIPFFYYPLENSKVHYHILIGMSGLIIFATWFGVQFKRITISNYKLTDWKRINKYIISLYYFLIIGIILGLKYSATDYQYIGLGRYIKLTALEQIINNSIFLILVILFLKLLVNFQNDINFQKKIREIFLFTIFIQIFSQMLYVLGINNIFFNLFSPGVSFNRGDVRNLGLWGGFGLGVYVVLIISFSVLDYKEHPKLSKFSIIAALIFSVLTSERQTIAFSVLFFFILFLIYLLKGIIPIKYFFVVFIVFVFAIISWSIISKLNMWSRFDIAFYYLKQGDLLTASGRQTKGIDIAIWELRQTPFLGKGLLNLGKLNYVNTNIAHHIVWFNIFQKFGIIGVIYLFSILIFPIIRIGSIIKKTKNYLVFNEGAILISLMFIVFAQQFFDNFFAFSNTMLLYAFIYFFVFSFINRNSTI